MKRKAVEENWAIFLYKWKNYGIMLGKDVKL